MRCIWCNTPSSYYVSVEHSQRQNCRVSDSGYHEFQSNSSMSMCLWHCLGFAFVRRRVSQSLIEHRREKRPNTI